MYQHESDGLDKEQILVKKIGHFGVYLFNAIFFNWSYSACFCNQPNLAIPDKCPVGFFLRAVIYYVTGWTLQTKSQVKIFAKDNRQIYFGFVETHFLEANIATEAGLPTTRVAKRKKNQRAMMFCSNKYFNLYALLSPRAYTTSPLK